MEMVTRDTKVHLSSMKDQQENKVRLPERHRK